MADQNYKNHIRLIPMYHYAAYAGITVLMGGSVYKLIRNYTLGRGELMIPALLIITSVVLLLLTWYTRVFALKAHDKAIRGEENLRHFALTGKLLDSRLSIRQVVALRFAPDNEFISLAQKAAQENMGSSDIKKAIKDWKADHNRV